MGWFNHQLVFKYRRSPAAEVAISAALAWFASQAWKRHEVVVLGGRESINAEIV